jgi:tetratricopeptide (TPR) repeat protein
MSNMQPPTTRRAIFLITGFMSLMLAGNCLMWWLFIQSQNAPGSPINEALVSSPPPTQVIQPKTITYDRTFGPAYIIWAHGRPLPELRAWAKDWKSQTTVDRSHLSNLIESSDLSALECLQIGELISHDAGYEIGKIWIGQGLQRAQEELRASATSHSKTRSLLSALATAQDRLQGHADAAPLAEKMNGLVIRYAPVAGSDHTQLWAKFHLAEALILEDRYGDAQVEARTLDNEALNNRHWTNDERRELASLLARIPVDPDATSPLDVVTAHVPKSSGLFQWVEKWQASASTPAAFQRDWDSDAATARNLIQQVGLSPNVCLRISELMFDKDAWNAEIFAQAGVDGAQAALANVRRTDTAAWSTINALERVEARLWNIEGDETVRGQILEGIASILLRFERESPWDQRPEWAKIGHGEALYLQGQYAPALKEADALIAAAKSDSHYTGEEKSGIYWLKAVVLFDTGRFNEALEPLQYTATHTEYAHAKDAAPLWAIALAKSGDTSQANSVFDDWIRQDRPTVEVASEVLERIQGNTIR